MRVGAIIYATDQGLGVLARDFYDAGVIQKVLVFRHPHGDRPSHMEWYPGAAEMVARPFRGPAVEDFLKSVDVVLYFETPFDWDLVGECRRRNIRTVLIPMYEWYLEHPPRTFDAFINPSRLDQDYFPQGTFIPIPAPQGTWQCRHRARTYLHNSGHIGSRGHKGTLELLQAMPYVKSPLKLIVRSQEVEGLRELLQAVPEAANDPRIEFVFGDVPYTELFAEGDVYVAPEKYNGLSLPLQEACAAGLLVMTTDRYPANTWLSREPLIPVTRYQRARTSKGHLEFDEAIVDPLNIARVMDAWYGQDISGFSRRGLDYANQHSWEVLKPRYLEALQRARQLPVRPANQIVHARKKPAPRRK